MPTGDPTSKPSPSPTEAPTGLPTDDPTRNPTPEATDEPTQKPSPSPTDAPTGIPTGEPTQEPSPSPTDAPTGIPTGEPTDEPSPSPTDAPTDMPTSNPTPRCEENTDYFILGFGWEMYLSSIDKAVILSGRYDQDGAVFINENDEDLQIWFEKVGTDHVFIVGNASDTRLQIVYLDFVGTWTDDDNPIIDSDDESEWEPNDETLEFVTSNMTLFDCEGENLGSAVYTDYAHVYQGRSSGMCIGIVVSFGICIHVFVFFCFIGSKTGYGLIVIAMGLMMCIMAILQ